jgi:3-phosphoshikimate 1-carboxyvinyltransferase
MAFAAARHGARFTGTRRLKIKESDRGTAMQQELAKMGVRVDMAEDEITVFSGIRPPREHLYGHNDHRIVMALSILLTRTGGTIDGAEAVAKSLPDFFERMTGLGIQVSYEP